MRWQARRGRKRVLTGRGVANRKEEKIGSKDSKKRQLDEGRIENHLSKIGDPRFVQLESKKTEGRELGSS